MVKEQKLDEFSEEIRQFNAKVSRAKNAGQEWVETSRRVIDFYNPSGLGGAKFFLFNGVKVCEEGLSDTIEKECNEPIPQKLHGALEGTESVR